MSLYIRLHTQNLSDTLGIPDHFRHTFTSDPNIEEIIRHVRTQYNLLDKTITLLYGSKELGIGHADGEIDSRLENAELLDLVQYTKD